MNVVNRTYLLLVSILSMILVASVLLGAVDIDLTRIWAALFSQTSDSFTIVDYRLPRAFIAIVVGALLALAGVLVQGVIRNPLASPDILGVSHGAGLAAVSWLIFMPGLAIYWLPAIALLGGIAAAFVLFLLQPNFRRPMQLALIGIATSAFFAGLIDFLILTHPLEANNALLWLTGSLWGRSWTHLWLILPGLLLVPSAFYFAQPLNLLALGEMKASNLGVNVTKTRVTLLSLAVIWTSLSVAVCGPLAFLGLVAPHLARQLVGGKHQHLIGASMLVGAILLLTADLFSRIIMPPTELPAGIITALIGAPYFIYLLIKLR